MAKPKDLIANKVENIVSESSKVFKGASAAYEQALADGYSHASSIYVHPKARIKLAKMLQRSRDAENELAHLKKEDWRYNHEKEIIVGPTDEHGLYRNG